jgi:hypothetical protein
MASIRDYFRRPLPTADHDDYDDPVTGAEIIRDIQQFNFLYQDCFSHHLVEDICGDPDELHAELDDAKRIIDSDNLDAYFIHQKGIEPKLTQTANNSASDKKEREVSFPQFLKAISDPPLPRTITKKGLALGENRVTYLIGDAGMGKSFAVLRAIDAMRGYEADHRGYRIIPVYVDLHDGASSPSHDLHNVDVKFFRTLTIKIIEHASERGAKELAQYQPPESIEAAVSNIKQLCKTLAEQKFFLFIAFDNADRYYFESAKYVFFEDYAKQRDQRIEDNFLALINKFVSESELGKIGASILFVCRKYVYSHCRQLQDTAYRARATIAKHTAFQLYPITGTQLVETRFDLMKDSISAVRKKYASRGEKYNEQLEQLEESMKLFLSGRDDKTINAIWKLAHEGHRSFLDFLCQIEVDYRADHQVIDRLFKKPHNLMRLYLTNLRKRYSQKISTFPNIFLSDALIDHRPGFELAHKPHKHTYWLKYLILRFVHQQPKHVALSADIVEFFTTDAKYEEHLVRLAIGSLADPCFSRCLDVIPRQQTSSNVQLLQLSERGKILLGTQTESFADGLAFTFDYLQLVTDDFWLALPTPWFSQIYVEASIAHTLKNNDTYKEGAKKTLEAKVPAALHFLRVLEASHDWEMNVRPELKRLSICERGFLNFDIIWQDTIVSISKILGSIPDPVNKILQEAHDLRLSLRRDKRFDDHFRNYERADLNIRAEM